MWAFAKRCMGRVGAEVLFWFGDGAWRVFDGLYALFEHEYEELDELPWHMRLLWSAYQSAMCGSNTVQDWGGAAGPWRELTRDEMEKLNDSVH